MLMFLYLYVCMFVCMCGTTSTLPKINLTPSFQNLVTSNREQVANYRSYNSLVTLRKNSTKTVQWHVHYVMLNKTMSSANFKHATSLHVTFKRTSHTFYRFQSRMAPRKHVVYQFILWAPQAWYHKAPAHPKGYPGVMPHQRPKVNPTCSCFSAFTNHNSQSKTFNPSNIQWNQPESRFINKLQLKFIPMSDNKEMSTLYID